LYKWFRQPRYFVHHELCLNTDNPKDIVYVIVFWIVYGLEPNLNFTSKEMAWTTNINNERYYWVHVCGGKTYKLIWNLTTPGKPSEKTFAELVELVQQHQHPKHWAIVKWFKFNTRFRKPGESIASYVAELRSLSEQCDFKRCYRWSVDVWNKWRTDSAQIVSRKFSRLYESHKNSYINGDCSKERTRFYISAM
jgi:hypothetical protein